MSEQPPPLPPSGIPPQPPPLHYQTPAGAAPPVGPAQKVFDTVIGPNVRLKDNLIQLACVIVGAGAGAAIGYALGGQPGLLFGILGGLIGSLILSGAVIGIIRLMTARRR
jgi:hypothetical protein